MAVVGSMTGGCSVGTGDEEAGPGGTWRSLANWGNLLWGRWQHQKNFYAFGH